MCYSAMAALSIATPEIENIRCCSCMRRGSLRRQVATSPQIFFISIHSLGDHRNFSLRQNVTDGMSATDGLCCACRFSCCLSSCAVVSRLRVHPDEIAVEYLQHHSDYDLLLKQTVGDVIQNGSYVVTQTRAPWNMHLAIASYCDHQVQMSAVI